MINNLQVLEKKIKDTISYLTTMNLPIKEILTDPGKYDDIKSLFPDYKVIKKDLGYFSCAIKYLDDKKEKVSFLM